ncbi:MAG: hypothetical protein ACRCXC_12060 [Legionella sp.]
MLKSLKKLGGAVVQGAVVRSNKGAFVRVDHGAEVRFDHHTEVQFDKNGAVVPPPPKTEFSSSNRKQSDVEYQTKIGSTSKHSLFARDAKHDVDEYSDESSLKAQCS